MGKVLSVQDQSYNSSKMLLGNANHVAVQSEDSVFLLLGKTVQCRSSVKLKACRARSITAWGETVHQTRLSSAVHQAYLLLTL